MQNMNIAPVPEKMILSNGNSVSRKSEEIAQEIDGAERDAELRKACADFEALFLHKLLKSMRKTIPKSSLVDGGLREDIYRDMLDEKIAEAAAHGKGTGLGERLYQDMRRSLNAKDGVAAYENNMKRDEEL